MLKTSDFNLLLDKGGASTMAEHKKSLLIAIVIGLQVFIAAMMINALASPRKCMFPFFKVYFIRPGDVVENLCQNRILDTRFISSVP